MSVAVLGFENWVGHCKVTIICEHFSYDEGDDKKDKKGLHWQILIKAPAYTLKKPYSHELKQ